MDLPRRRNNSGALRLPVMPAFRYVTHLLLSDVTLYSFSNNTLTNITTGGVPCIHSVQHYYKGCAIDKMYRDNEKDAGPAHSQTG